MQFASAERTISRIASLVAIAIWWPASWTFFQAWKESIYLKVTHKQFINSSIAKYEFLQEMVYFSRPILQYWIPWETINLLFDLIFRKEDKLKILWLKVVFFMGDEN